MFQLSDIIKIVPTRNFNMTYVMFDMLFLVFLVTILVFKKRLLTLCWGLFGGLLYLAVDFGLFYCASHTRAIYINGDLLDTFGHFLILFWLSLSYGIPNFVFIWLALSKDKLFKPFAFLIIGWWIVLPTLSQFGSMEALEGTFFAWTIKTERQTGNFHWIMGLFLVIGYGAYIAYIIFKDKQNYKEHLKNLVFLNIIGIATQFSWELPLLINGIRPYDDTAIQTLIVNSLIETNSGMVYFYLFHYWITKKKGIQEDLSVLKKENVETTASM